MAATICRVKEPKNLSPRIKWLRDYYFKGVDRAWNNEFQPFTTGVPWDVLYDEISYYVVPETYVFFQTIGSSMKQAAYEISPPEGFWEKSIVERRAWFIKEAVVNHLPQELLPVDLIAGARFNLMASRCWNKSEGRKRNGIIYGKNGARQLTKEFHDRGFGNCGATSGHLIPWYERVLKIGFQGIHDDIKDKYEKLTANEKNGSKGAQLRAMMEASTMPGDLACKYADLCSRMAAGEGDETRKHELLQMERNLRKVPWQPAETFWEAIQALWISHMLVISDECFPGAGTSFGRLDQYLLPYWERSVGEGMDREFGKEILKCFWIHCNTAYDAMIKTGSNQGITAGFGQLFNLSGMGRDGRDMTNELTLVFLEVIDDMSPILEPKPNIRLHRNSPEELLDKVADMISSSQGAPFLLNFDERSMAGLLREAEAAGIQNLINKDNVFEYSGVGCLENTMVGNDRSGTVDCNINLLKAVELVLGGGRDLIEYSDLLTGKKYQVKPEGSDTGDPRSFKTWDEFYGAFEKQLIYIIKKCVDLYEITEAVRAEFSPTPYLSCLVKGCAEKGLDITGGGAEIKFATVEGVTFATAVDSLLAVKYLVFDKKECTMEQLIKALRNNWEGYEVLRARARNKAPKYGRDDDEADKLAVKVMKLWSDEVLKYKTGSTDVRFRGGMLSWNYWVSDGYLLAASADGRKKGEFLSNAICPSNEADINGPTANVNSVGKALGGRSQSGGDFMDYVNYLPNGASHTITFNPSLIRDSEHRNKFKAFLRGYAENGGTALQINILDSEMLLDAQKNPDNYRNLLVRVTGYNAYFTSIGRELQNEIIARESHNRF